MRNLPVHWSEGMFLRPHHFQAAERYWTEAGQTSEKWDHHYNYGLRSIELSKEAIANYKIQVSVCHARMPDGSLIALDAGQEPDRVDLKTAVLDLNTALADLTEAFESETVVRVYLAVPKLKMGRANVVQASTENVEPARFLEASLSIQDESRGGNDQDIQHRSLNVRILLSTEDLSGYEILPIAQIRRVGEGESTPALDEDYVPPLLAVDAWDGLDRGIVRAIYDIIGQKIEVLSEQVLNRGISLASQDPGDLERLLMLMALNEASAKLGVLTFAKGVHPLVMYAELCHVVGRLAIFSAERRLPEIPAYDHDDLARIFKWIKRKIEELIHAVKQDEFEQRYFVGAGTGMQVALDSKWLNSDWNWYVGVHPGNMSQRECQELLSVGSLDWKMGSSAQVDWLFKNRAQGLQLVPLTQAPRALPARGGWIYYEVSRENAAWKDVQESQTLAMRFKEELISNLDSLQGERHLSVSAKGKMASLQFALFAVPTR
jgi:type VI secretion system protein ImpJ